MPPCGSVPGSSHRTPAPRPTTISRPWKGCREIASSDLLSGAAQDRLCELVVDLGMAWHGLLSCAVCPYVMLASVSQEPSPESSQLPLRLPPLHHGIVHVSVCKGK